MRCNLIQHGFLSTERVDLYTEAGRHIEERRCEDTGSMPSTSQAMPEATKCQERHETAVRRNHPRGVNWELGLTYTH